MLINTTGSFFAFIVFYCNYEGCSFKSLCKMALNESFCHLGCCLIKNNEGVMSIKDRLVLMIMGMLVGMFIIAGVLSWSMNDLRIGGDTYNKIISDKDLLADILPPPEYVLESYLTVYQLLDAEQTDKSVLWKTMDRLKSEYETRKQFWLTQSLPDNLQLALTQSQQDVDAFYRFVQEYKLHQNDEMTTAIISKIQQSYMAHRTAIDTLVSLSNAHFEAVSAAAENSLSRDVWIVVIALAIVILFSLVQGIATLKRIMHPLQQIQAVIAQVREGDFSVRSAVSGKDELSTLGRSVNALLENLQSSFNQSIELSASFASGIFGHRMSENLPGDMGKLATNLNHSFVQAEASMQMVGSILNAVKMGILFEHWSGKGHYAHLKGVWHSAVADGEQALKNREGVLHAILVVMIAAADGDFSKRTNFDANGLFKELADTIDCTMAQLESVIADINRVILAQSKGDLSMTISADTKGQLQSMKDSINHSITHMRGVVHQIASSSHVVGDVAVQVSQSAHDLSARVQAQAAALEETTASIHEMSHAVKSNADNARSASQLVSDMQTKAEMGVDVMKQTINAMSAISESSHRIADIVSIIDSIAFQTNLLALNAAVEAARAGEHGRGFAVVASEVRALAQKSSDAAKDIRGLIQDSVGRVDMGTMLADQSGVMLQSIQQEIAQFSGAIEQIACASAEQTQGIMQVNLAIASIDKATQENSALVQETTAAAESMSSEAASLRQQVSIFRLNASPS